MDPEEVLESIEEAAVQRGLPIIGPKRGRSLDEIIEEHNPQRILEVGTLVGYSAIRMGRHLGKEGRVVCVELRDDMAREARSNIKKAGLDDRIEVKVGDALKVLPTLSGSFDMLFLDAVKEDYINYLKLVEGLLHPGSLVVADNVKSHAEEVAGYLEYVRNSGKYKSAYRESKDTYRYGSGRLEADAVEVSVKL